MDKEDLVPGLQYVLEHELTRKEISVILYLLDNDRTIYELQEIMKVRAVSSIYSTLRTLLLKNVIEQYTSPGETMRRYKLL